MSGFAFGQQRLVTDAQNLIFKMQQRAVYTLQSRAYQDLIIIKRGSFIADVQVRDCDVAVVLFFHVTVLEPILPQQFHPSYFKPHDEVRVIHHAHLVRFSIADAKSRLSSDALAHIAAAQPFQTGLRFSRNEVMPSLKSAVCRMAAFSFTACVTCRSSCSCV